MKGTDHTGSTNQTVKQMKQSLWETSNMAAGDVGAGVEEAGDEEPGVEEAGDEGTWACARVKVEQAGEAEDWLS